MIDVKKFLGDKTTWKICESVRLGLDTIYLTFFRLENAVREFERGRDEGMYASFEKSAKDCYKYTLTKAVMDDYRENILPHLPCFWWIDRQPWMPYGDKDVR